MFQSFNINTESDKQGVQPEKICFGCWTKLRKKELNPERRLFIDIYNWDRHYDDSCKECQHFRDLQKGGKTKIDGNQGKGRPKKLTSQTSTDGKTKTTRFIPTAVIPAPITIERLDLDRFINLFEDLVCPVCKDVLYQPVQSPCEHNYCYCCLENCFSLYPADCPCPTCKTALKADDIKKPQRMLVNLLNATLVRCAICKAPTKHEFLDNHEKNCSNYRTGLQEDTEVSTVLRKPLNEPLDPVESKLATRLFKRIRTSSPTDLLTLKTGGTVSIKNLTILHTA